MPKLLKRDKQEACPEETCEVLFLIFMYFNTVDRLINMNNI